VLPALVSWMRYDSMLMFRQFKEQFVGIRWQQAPQMAGEE